METEAQRDDGTRSRPLAAPTWRPELQGLGVLGVGGLLPPSSDDPGEVGVRSKRLGFSAWRKEVSRVLVPCRARDFRKVELRLGHTDSGLVSPSHLF